MSVLLSKAQLRKLPAIGATEQVDADDKVFLAKVFAPEGRFTFYIAEGELRDDGDWLLFGWVVSPLDPAYDEWGYSSLSELASVRTPRFRLKMERDKWFDPQTFRAMRGGLRDLTRGMTRELFLTLTNEPTLFAASRACHTRDALKVLARRHFDFTEEQLDHAWHGLELERRVERDLNPEFTK